MKNSLQYTIHEERYCSLFAFMAWLKQSTVHTPRPSNSLASLFAL